MKSCLGNGRHTDLPQWRNGGGGDRVERVRISMSGELVCESVGVCVSVCVRVGRRERVAGCG